MGSAIRAAGARIHCKKWREKGGATLACTDGAAALASAEFRDAVAPSWISWIEWR
jgi:hypothetical protein